MTRRDEAPRRLLYLPAIMIAGIVLIQGEALAGSSPGARVVETWKKKLAEIEQTLRAEDYVTGAEACSDLAQDLMEKVGIGGSSAQMLSLISAYRAIAATAQGHPDEGLWHWRTAQILYPGIDGVDFRAFGPIPERLKATPLRGGFPAGSLYRTLPENGKAVKPKLRRHPRAIYPQGMVDLDIESKYRVEFVVDTDGTIKESFLITRVAEPCLVYAMMDALRKWTFKPALIEGNPVAFVWIMEYGFDIIH